MTEHAGRVAVVTGGSSGIGRGVAEVLAREGAAVVVHGLERAEALGAADDLVASGASAAAVWGPIDDPATSRDAVETALARFGRLDTLVTSAGIQRYGDVVETTDAVWAEVFGINVTGVFLALRAALPTLRASGSGSVAVISSAQAVASQPRVAAYAASKGALNALARSVAVDEGPRGVRVNSILPGSVDTPMLRASAALLGGVQKVDDVLCDWGRSHPVGRIARSAEIGEVVSFVTSPRAGFLTGAEIRVDGGLLAVLGAPLPG